MCLGLSSSNSFPCHVCRTEGSGEAKSTISCCVSDVRENEPACVGVISSMKDVNVSRGYVRVLEAEDETQSPHLFVSFRREIVFTNVCRIHLIHAWKT